MSETLAPSRQPTSSPSGLWIAPSVPADTVSDFTAEPTNNHKYPNSYDSKSNLESTVDADTMAQSRYLFIGIVIIVIAIAVIYLRRRYVN